MAYDEFLAERMQRVLEDKRVAFVGKRMMGGFVFMVDDKMCVGVVKKQMMVRFDHEDTERISQRKGYAPMDFTGRSMKGFAMVNPEGVDNEEDLAEWIQIGLDFNPKAQKSKKRQKKSST